MTRSKEHSQQLGWLKNEARLRRKTTPPCLTDKQVQFMLSQICDFKDYTKQEPNIDTMIKIRDSALIATNWIWFKRANEILRIKFGDVTLTDTQVARATTRLGLFDHKADDSVSSFFGFRNKITSFLSYMLNMVFGR